MEDGGMRTKTAGLFDEHLKDANLKLTALQTHFHSPAEHAIDGQIFDLEMHIVHAMPKNVESQFSNGVLGFIFKVVKDDYFDKNDDYHDKFLQKLIADHKIGE